MIRFELPSLALLALTLACKPSGSEDQPPTRVDPSELPGPVANAETGQVLRAAGLELRVPSDWIVLAEQEPNFALAYREEQRSTHIPVCTIELRRQGPGSLPDGAQRVDADADVFEYQRGALRGRVRSLPGPDASSVVVHCRAPRSTQQWATIIELFDSIEPLEGATVELPPERPTPAPDSVVELCVGAPARMTMACARRADGAVYCGATTSGSLQRIALTEPAVEISCASTIACARAATGAVECWRGVDTPTPMLEVGAARQIVGALIVDERGKLLRRGPTGVAELAPFDDPTLALTEVERVLPGTDAAAGCVLRDAGLWCWDSAYTLPVELEPGGRPQRVADAAKATDLRRMGDRLCLAIDGRWTCTDKAGERFVVDDCGARACGCSLIGASRWSCEHEPYHPIDARPLGRVANVVATADPCAALADGTVVCRGPLAGQSGDDPRTTKAIVAELPGIAHVLDLVD